MPLPGHLVDFLHSKESTLLLYTAREHIALPPHIILTFMLKDMQEGVDPCKHGVQHFAASDEVIRCCAKRIA